MDNVHQYGFRWVGSMDGSCYPKPLDFTVATGYQASISGNVDLNIGDPVQLTTDGTMILAVPAQAPSIYFGVIAAVYNAKVDANGYSRPASFLPGGTTWSNETLRSRIGVIPFGRNIWEIDCKEVLSGATTIADYRALIGENVDGDVTRDVTNPGRPKANPTVTTVGHTPSSGKDFRVIDVSKTAANQDFTGKFVKLRVVINETGEAPFVTVGV